MELFTSPIGRLAFLGRFILSLLVIGTGKVILHNIKLNEYSPVVLIYSFAQLAFLLGGIFYMIKYAVFARLQSIGLSKWYTIIIIIPLVNLIFFIYLALYPEKQSVVNDELSNQSA